MDKVVILARVSTQAQDYQRQVTELKEYCDRAGWEVTSQLNYTTTLLYTEIIL